MKACRIRTTPVKCKKGNYPGSKRLWYWNTAARWEKARCTHYMQDCEMVPLQGTRNDQNMQWNAASDTNKPHRQEDRLGEFSESNFWTQRENKVKALVTFKSLQIFCGTAFKQCQNLTELKARAQELQSGTIKQASRTYSALSLENDWILTVSAVLLWRIYIYI